jgi:shikimate kinase
VTPQRRKIILTGYRATGKSVVGRALADRLEVSFIDMDEVLTARYGEISEVVKERGWDYFRTREKELLTELAAAREVVISAGGGAVMHRQEWQALKDTGLVVWLTADLETICRRLGADPLSGSQRPSLTGEDIRTEAARVLAEREPLYRQGSHLEIDSTRSVPEVVAEIEKVLAENSYI